MHQATCSCWSISAPAESGGREDALALQEYGNTVSSTLPLLMHDLRAAGRLRPGTQTLLISFGVGLSWAGCSWTETWRPRNRSSSAAAAEHCGRPSARKTTARASSKPGPMASTRRMRTKRRSEVRKFYTATSHISTITISLQVPPKGGKFPACRGQLFREIAESQPWVACRHVSNSASACFR